MGAHRQLTRLVKVSAAAVDGVRAPAPGVVVLAYHRVGGRSGSSVDLPRPLFAAQIAHLAAHHAVSSLDDAVDRLDAAPRGTSERVVVVSFDDGTADFADEAIDVLVAHRVPAVLYLATDHVERGVAFPDDGTPLSWSALRDLVATGLVTVGSHTHTHRLLDRVDAATAAEELDRSIALVEDRLGVSCRHFAYPKALPAPPGTEGEVRRRFRSAAVSGCRPNRWGATDVHRLARSPIQRSDGLGWFRRKAAGGMHLEADLRRALDRRRYRSAAV